MRQSAARILMIRPSHFRKNVQTGDNAFQKNMPLSEVDAHERASKEFAELSNALIDKGIRVYVGEAPFEKDTPDALFPNNWVSFHQDGRIALYPMKAENRRLERNEKVITALTNEWGLLQNEIIDFTEFESHSVYLEGTGSLVLDRINKKAYCCISERSDLGALGRFCSTMGYTAVPFNAHTQNVPVYHTNVIMSVGTHFAVLCADAIKDVEEKEKVVRSLRENQKRMIFISEAQMANFAGNILEVLNEEGLPFIVMSESARNAFSSEQISELEHFGEIISADLTTIETLGGGSARCMLCEVFLPKM